MKDMKRVGVRIDPKEYQQARIKLIHMGKTFSDWVREEVKKLLSK